MRILVVDDEPLVASTLGLIFRKHGFDAQTVASADSALASALEHPPDIVLCDIDMPGKDGISLMQDLGRQHPTVPILVLTGSYPSLVRVRDCARTLPQEVLVVTKPCQPSELLRTAGSMLKIA